MKKIISVALVAILLVTVLVLPTSAASQNAKVTIQHTQVAPILDGVVNTGEYGTFKVHSVDYSKDEFISAYDKNKKVKSDFYMTWTDDSLYMAWVVTTDGHWPIPENYDHGDGTGGLGYMYMFSCVQFMLCTGAPNASEKVYQTATWSGNYLEVGLSVMEDGSSLKIAWSKPIGGENLTVDDWDFVGVRDNAKKTTTYEVRIPWTKSGITSVGNGAKFGLTYAVADQSKEDFLGDNAKMAEWQDAILGGKNMDAGAIITLEGRGTEESSIVLSKELEDGDWSLPDEDATELDMVGLNASITAGSSSLITKITQRNSYNIKYSLNVLAKPVSGKADTFAISEIIKGDGTNPAFTSAAEGDIILAFHSDGEGYAGFERVQLAEQLIVGDEIVVKGVDMTKHEYSHKNPLVYVARDLDGAPVDESSDDTTSDPGTETSDPGVESSAAESSPAPNNDSSATTEESGNTALIVILIIVGVLVVGGAVYFLVIKRKK